MRPALRRPARVPTARAALTSSSLIVAALAGAACQSSADERPAATAAATAASGTPATPAASAVAPAADSLALRAAADSGRILGAPSAKVWLIIASDFQCPYCKVWHDDTFETLRREYVATGKVRMAFVNFPLNSHAQAEPAAEASMCASAQGRFWEYHTAVFRAQEQWSRAGDQTAAWEAAAQQVGLDLARFRACRTSGVMRAVVVADRDRMERAGVNSTPSFFVGDARVAGAQPVAVFRAALDSALAAAR